MVVKNNFWFVDQSVNNYFLVEQNQEINHYYLVIANDNLELNLEYELGLEAIVNVTALVISNNQAKVNLNLKSYSKSLGANFNGQVTVLGLKQSESKISLYSQVEPNIKHNKVNQQILGLILSDKARITGEPNLKIDTDEILAKHALNIGSLNKEELFYLQTKGISQHEAQRLIISGLINEVLLGLEETEQKKYLSLIEQAMQEA